MIQISFTKYKKMSKTNELFLEMLKDDKIDIDIRNKYIDKYDKISDSFLKESFESYKEYCETGANSHKGVGDE